MFSFRGHRTLKPRSKFILRNLIFYQFKLNGRKLGFNTPLIYNKKYYYASLLNKL